MDPLTAMMLIGGGVQVAGGIIGALIQNGKTDEARAIIQQARNQYGEISEPNLQKAALETLGPSEFAKLQPNSQAAGAQASDLDKMGAIISGNGLTDEDKAVINRLRNSSAQREMADRASIQENMAARGVGGSGAELAAELKGSQDAAENNSQSDLDVAAQAQKRYLDALRSQFSMASDLRNSQWGEDAQRASAQDAINRFNLGHAYDVQQYNNTLAQQQYNDQMQKANAMAGSYADEANLVNGQGAREGQAVAGGAQGLGQAVEGAGYYNYGPGSKSKSATAGQSQYGQEPDPNDDIWHI